MPGSRRSFTYRPDSFVTTVSAVFRSTLVIVTVAPGTMPPVESVMTPATLPYTACARVDDGFPITVSSAMDTESRCSTVSSGPSAPSAVKTASGSQGPG